MKIMIFKTKEGDLYEAYSIDRKNRLVGGYRLFSGYGESNPFRIFSLNDVITVSLSKEPKEEALK